jgi:hypothetical protein
LNETEGFLRHEFSYETAMNKPAVSLYLNDDFEINKQPRNPDTSAASFERRSFCARAGSRLVLGSGVDGFIFERILEQVLPEMELT